MSGITKHEVMQLLHYDSLTGQLHWIVNRRGGVKRGDLAGCLDPYGYVQIYINRKAYKAHRLAWLLQYGEHPIDKIDHINGVKNDNRLCNLRNASHKQNLENVKLSIASTSGFRGVSFVRSKNKWKAQITHNYRNYNLGLYNSAEQAALAAKQARDCLFTHHKTSYSS